jgi:hypothetical protein
MPEAQGNAAPKTFRSFLESTPPNSVEQVSDLFGEGQYSGAGWLYPLRQPDIQLHCETCEGPRNFQSIDDKTLFKDNTTQDLFLRYVCRNCRKTSKTYGVRVERGTGKAGAGLKFGELPAFGPHTPARVITLIGPDKDLFLRGRRAENQGMGIGSFSYYRRVVENQKGRIIAEIGRVAQKLGAKPVALDAFKRAEKETQFTKAIDEIKDGIPEVLRIGGHNPLTLLHAALSEGLHEHTDAECLEIAQEIRLVPTELAERISIALKEEAELQTAVSRLLSRKSGSGPAPTA